MAIGSVVRSALRLGVVMSAALLVSACGGGGSSPLYANGTCNPGTQVQLTSPSSGQTAVGTNTNQIVIVANGNGNTLAYTYQNWYVTLTATNGTVITSGTFNQYADPNAPHPYQSDYFYNASIGGLASNTTYGVMLQQGGVTCTPITLGSFST